ncbi:hypothetical protein FACS1894120_4050 [Clostridia bacterium]|nr:hypothetical protein FACS1894120_4050 [Clostridia bacterium]
MKKLEFGSAGDLEIFKSLTAGEEISEAVHSDYAELIRILGIENTLKLFNSYHGCKINCPKYLYKPEFVVRIAAEEPDKRQRERIAILCGYTAGRLESLVKEYKKEQTGRIENE